MQPSPSPSPSETSPPKHRRCPTTSPMFGGLRKMDDLQRRRHQISLKIGSRGRVGSYVGSQEIRALPMETTPLPTRKGATNPSPGTPSSGQPTRIGERSEGGGDRSEGGVSLAAFSASNRRPSFTLSTMPDGVSEQPLSRPPPTSSLKADGGAHTPAPAHMIAPTPGATPAISCSSTLCAGAVTHGYRRRQSSEEKRDARLKTIPSCDKDNDKGTSPSAQQRSYEA